MPVNFVILETVRVLVIKVLRTKHLCCAKCDVLDFYVFLSLLGVPVYGYTTLQLLNFAKCAHLFPMVWMTLFCLGKPCWRHFTSTGNQISCRDSIDSQTSILSLLVSDQEQNWESKMSTIHLGNILHLETTNMQCVFELLVIWGKNLGH